MSGRAVESQHSGESPTSNRQMTSVDLLGSHSHQCRNGIWVHLWRRDGRYLARGSFQGHRFGETLGNNGQEAAARLRELIVEIDAGRYIRPSESKTSMISTARPAQLLLRQLTNAFLAEKRKLLGKKTTGTYKSRLLPILEFAERPANCKRFPFAESIDREFVIDLRAFLYERSVTPNGRPGAKPRRMSARGIINTLECLRTMLLWAHRADVRKLPVSWSNPLTQELIGEPPAKDPFREDSMPPDARIKLVQHMDFWQLTHLSLSLILPLRPGEAVGLLISDVDFAKRSLLIGTRFGGADFTKARQSFRLPFPSEIEPILRKCIDGRAEGPLLRSRRAFAGAASSSSFSTTEELVQHFDRDLKQRPSGTVQNDQDRKQVFRELLRKRGGATEDRMAFEFQRIVRSVGITGVTLYALRHANTKGLKDAGVPQLEMRYLTAHSTSDILNEYTPLDPVAAMQRYFDSIQPLLKAISARTAELSLDEFTTAGRTEAN